MATMVAIRMMCVRCFAAGLVCSHLSNAIAWPRASHRARVISASLCVTVRACVKSLFQCIPSTHSINLRSVRWDDSECSGYFSSSSIRRRL
uniref:Putative secreted protein n=1 Tax=Anopheles darlingi TaxID=43151 RepID=A0A2M4D6A4_ANODA